MTKEEKAVIKAAKEWAFIYPSEGPSAVKGRLILMEAVRSLHSADTKRKKVNKAK